MGEGVLSHYVTYNSIWSNVFSVIAFLAFLEGILIGASTFPPIIAAVAVKEPVIASVVRHLSCGGCNEREKVNIERINKPGKEHFDSFKLHLLLYRLTVLLSTRLYISALEAETVQISKIKSSLVAI